MGAVNPQRIEQANRIIGHIGDVIGQPRPQPEQACEHYLWQIGLAGLVKMGRQANIAVVMADHVITARHQRIDQFDRPAGQLHSQSHDQQHRRVRRIAEGFVFDLDAIGSDFRHSASLHDRSGTSRHQHRVFGQLQRLGEIEDEMQPPAFVTGERRADDQFGRLQQIAKLDQIGRNAEVAKDTVLVP